MLLQQRPLVVVGHPVFFETAALALPIPVTTAEVRAVGPRPATDQPLLAEVAHHRTPEVLAAARVRELGIAFALLDGEPAAALVGAVVTAVDVCVGVVHADRRARGRLLHVRPVGADGFQWSARPGRKTCTGHLTTPRRVLASYRRRARRPRRGGRLSRRSRRRHDDGRRRPVPVPDRSRRPRRRRDHGPGDRRVRSGRGREVRAARPGRGGGPRWRHERDRRNRFPVPH